MGGVYVKRGGGVRTSKHVCDRVGVFNGRDEVDDGYWFFFFSCESDWR